MVTWEEVFSTAKDMASNAGRKITNMADVVALKMELSEKERALRGVMEALGHLLYDSKKDKCEMNADLVAELVEQADVYYKQIGKLQREIDDLCSRKTCSCGAVNHPNASFCNDCGEKL